jgi:pyruvate formate lyase activating enzyme
MIAEALHPGRWWDRESGSDRVICDLCPRRCHLKPDQRGFCFVRMGTADGVALTTYGRSSGFCVDPIEKKPLYHFLPGTPSLSFGTAGCNLGCKFCQNWDISKAREMDALMDSALPDAIALAALRTGSKSVAYTYNDPVIFAEYAIDVAEACRKRGIANVAKSAGYITARARSEFFGAMDAVNIDLKAFTQDFYARMCFGELEPVKETLVWLVHHSPVWVEVTTLLIPGENDSDAELRALCTWVRDALRPDVPLHFSAYHPDFKVKIPATPPETLRRARRIAIELGLKYVYVGNVHDTAGDSTWCTTCEALLIERDWYQLGHWGLNGAGACAACGTVVPGRFEAQPGAWGARRMPIRLADPSAMRV